MTRVAVEKIWHSCSFVFLTIQVTYLVCRDGATTVVSKSRYATILFWST